MPRLRWFLLGALAVPVVLGIGMTAFVYSGTYAIGADRPHLPMTVALIDTLRDRSTEAAGKSIAVPDLDDPARITDGAGHYAAMCTGCHLAPGMADSELRTGLYPQPPNLAGDGIDDPGEAFWIIKHGLKMSAMPAWGKTHTDAQIWDLVAFVRQLPRMTPAQYRQRVAEARAKASPRDHGTHDHPAMQ